MPLITFYHLLELLFESSLRNADKHLYLSHGAAIRYGDCALNFGFSMSLLSHTPHGIDYNVGYPLPKLNRSQKLDK